jgi:hypothetical protein
MATTTNPTWVSDNDDIAFVMLNDISKVGTHITNLISNSNGQKEDFSLFKDYLQGNNIEVLDFFGIINDASNNATREFIAKHIQIEVLESSIGEISNDEIAAFKSKIIDNMNADQRHQALAHIYKFKLVKKNLGESSNIHIHSYEIQPLYDILAKGIYLITPKGMNMK